jgi:hypothetical protein
MFFKHFSLSIVQHSFSKLKRILILTIFFKKSLEVDEIHFLTHLINVFLSNMFLTLKIMNFDNMFLIRCNHKKRTKIVVECNEKLYFYYFEKLPSIICIKFFY